MRRASNIQKRWSTDQLITGIETADWLKLLSANGWKVDGTYLHRAAWIGALSVGATAAGRFEDLRYGRALASQEIDPEPLFLIGHWRSGTTHLHNLFGRVPENTYPTVFQCVFPTSFLTLKPIVPGLTAGLMDDTRTYDNVKQGWDEAAEDEIALAKMCGLSPYISFMFPENGAKYERYIDFIEATQDERDEWKESFRYFLKKVMYQTGGKRVVVKSCTHTARIRLILEMFPNAKFVHIHRHPYRVFSSTLHMRSHTDWENFFQVPEENWEDERTRQTLLLGQRIFERVTEDRRLIPEKNLVEIAYDDLVGNEVDVIRGIYEQFGYANWETAEQSIRSYLDGVGDYKVNALKISAKHKKMVRKYWSAAFDAYGYPEDYAG